MTEPVKVYVGTDPNMKKAEIALEWSIRKHTDSPVDIIWMDYARGGIWEGWNIGREYGRPYSPKGWATEFTNFRFAIPEANNFKGRAIYLDVDMIVLKDIRELFEFPMDRPMLHSRNGLDVILFDCAKFKDLDWWPSIEEMKKSDLMMDAYSRLLISHRFMSEDLPLHWDCLDGRGYDPENTGLVHYTDMNTQPWKPYPNVFEYPPHPRQDMVDLFWQYYEEGKENLKQRQ